MHQAAASEIRTPADAVRPLHIVAVVALEAFVVVARLPFVAVLVELSGAHFTAATGVQDWADPRGAGWGHHWTLTDHGAASSHLLEWRENNLVSQRTYIERCPFQSHTVKRKKKVTAEYLPGKQGWKVVSSTQSPYNYYSIPYQQLMFVNAIWTQTRSISLWLSSACTGERIWISSVLWLLTFLTCTAK